MEDDPRIPPEIAAAQAVLREIAAKSRKGLYKEGRSDAEIDRAIAEAMKVMEAFWKRGDSEPAGAGVASIGARAG